MDDIKTASLVLTYAEAAGVVREHAGQASPLDCETIPLLAALGQVLATPIVADRDQPPFPRSTRDGFACRAADVSAGKDLSIVGQLRAGEMWQGRPLAAGDAIEIMTGAPVPEGADCVVMIERVTQTMLEIRLESSRTMQPGENIVPAGAEARQGGVIVSAGTRMGSPQTAAAAAFGYAAIEVYRKPRVAILSTGDELVDIEAAPLPQQIRNSNSYSLAAQVLEAGAEPVILPIARDDRAHLEASIRAALACDLLLLSGGVSMGKYDFVEQVLLQFGAEFFFTGVLIQPGRPVVFGRVEGKYFFGLPGNPVSTMVTFLLFAAPLLGALSGQPDCQPKFAQAALSANLQSKAGLTRFLPAVLTHAIGAHEVAPLAWQGSGDLAATSRANCFAVVPPDCAQLHAGEIISVLLI